MDEEITAKLNDFYYNLNNVSAYSSNDLFYSLLREKGLKIPKKQVNEWLQNQRAHTLHKTRQNRFKRCRYNLTNIDDLWEADLIDMQNYSRKNAGNKYILAVIDCFSKFAWCIPIKRKTPGEIIKAIEGIFSQTERRPITIQTDKGREFDNKAVREFLKDRDILFQTTRDPVTKAAICERFIKTIKAIIFKYFTSKNTTRYVDIIESLVHIYNNRQHSSIGIAPSNVNTENVLEIWKFLNRKAIVNTRKPKYCLGDNVRVANPKQIFDKGYKQKWSEEVFTISKIIMKKPYVYRLLDSCGDLIKGNFYECEIQKIT